MSRLQIVTDLLDIQGWRIVPSGIVIEGESVKVFIERHWVDGHECSGCGEGQLPGYDHTWREVRDFPVWGRRCYLVFEEARVSCPKCGVRTERLCWLEPFQRQTLRYERYIAQLCEYLPALDVAELEGLDKGTVYRVDKKWLERREAHRTVQAVKQLGIDEIAVKKGHRYATVFYDLERREVIGLVWSRKERAVGGFFRRMGRPWCRGVEAVCLDLWRPFFNSVCRHLTKAVVVFDKFHVFSYLSQAIDEVRRIEQNKAAKDGRPVIKGARWLLLKTHDRLRRNQKQMLKQLLELNHNLCIAHLLKEEFAQFYASTDAAEAEEFLNDWTQRCLQSELEPFRKLAKRLQRHQDGLLAFFQHRITNGISEGINNKIKVLKRRSYGFHDFHYFVMKILSATGALPSMKDFTHTL